MTLLRRRHHPIASQEADADAALVARAATDPRVFEVLYRRYFPAVYGYCLAELENATEAEDAASQTFLRAMAGLDRVREAGKFRAWLFAIAHNAAVDQARRRGTATVMEGAMDAAAAVPDPGPGPEATALAALDLDRLVEAIGRLSAEDRRILALRRAGLPGAEIAAVLGITREAAKKRQLRAVERLLAAMEPERSGRSDGRGA